MEAAALPRTVEEIYKDYLARRAGLIKALTIDIDEFYYQCDPGLILKKRNLLFFVSRSIQAFVCSGLNFSKGRMIVYLLDKENLCLYGHPDETWEVNLPAEEVPPELPEPALGINFPRDGLDRKDWLSLVSVHSDVWLLAVSSFYSARLDRTERKRLFNMINEVPTIFEVVSGRKHTSSKDKEKTSVSNGSNKSKSSAKSGKDPRQFTMPSPEEEDLDEDEKEEHDDTFCGTCDGPYTSDEFWIGCDICEKWYHGKCVKITPAKAEHIEQYKCPACVGNKKPRV